MRHLLVLASVALLTGAAAAHDAETCQAYFVGTWTMEDETGSGKQVTTLAFDANGTAAHSVTFANGESRQQTATWTTAAGKEADTCEVSLKIKDGKTEITELKLLDDDSFEADGDIYRRVAPFDNATCPTYFVGEWTLKFPKARDDARRTVAFTADGGYRMVEESVAADGARTVENELVAQWAAAPGKAADRCDMTLKVDGVEVGVLETVIKGPNAFHSPKDGADFSRN